MQNQCLSKRKISTAALEKMQHISRLLVVVNKVKALRGINDRIQEGQGEGTKLYGRLWFES